jgi:hypothetical protein
MKQATYHPEDGRQVVFEILSSNGNGTVNLGFSDDPENPGNPLVVVGSCKITETVEIGSATAIVDSVEEGKQTAPKEPKAPKAPKSPKAPSLAPPPPAPTEDDQNENDQNEGDETPQ